jgi:hypothetical protein
MKRKLKVIPESYFNSLPPVTEEEAAEIEATRPRKRSDCKDGPRPCIFVGCRYHLLLEIGKNGNLKTNFKGEPDPTTMEETCALDLAENGGMTLEEISQYSSLTRERVRQIECLALHHSYTADPTMG